MVKVELRASSSTAKVLADLAMKQSQHSKKSLKQVGKGIARLMPARVMQARSSGAGLLLFRSVMFTVLTSECPMPPVPGFPLSEKIFMQEPNRMHQPVAANRGQQTIEIPGANMLGTRKHAIAFPAQPLSTSSSTVPEPNPFSRSAAFRHHTCCAIGKDEKRRNRRTKSRSIDGEVQETTCQKSALTFATYCVHPVSDPGPRAK